ncbi:MAG: 50S ribosomal protein L11 methyltransferase, partial [Pseudomonadota bacterium]|nr:50S ribosomal protein L11 methyltransferase [Pseudomonadota bacterium]
PEEQVDILISNILAEPLLNLAVTFSRLVKPGGKVVLSGLLENQVMRLISCYKQWFDISEAVVDNGWGILTGIRKA